MNIMWYTIPMKEIAITRGFKVQVDDRDYPWLIQHAWHTLKGSRNRTPYAKRTVGTKKTGRTSLMMHNAIMRPPLGLQVDHIDCNGLNNQRSNLRLCTVAQNQANSAPYRNGRSIYKGVDWRHDRKKWRATICVNGKRSYLGVFKTEEEAAHVYDKAAVELFGEFARINTYGS